MEKFLFIVEGIADAVFLRDYLHFLFEKNTNFIALDKIKAKKLNEKEKAKLQVFTKPIVTIYSMGGCSKIDLIVEPILKHYQGYKLLIIQDADDESKDFGGYENRIDYLKGKQKEHDLSFEIFLLPNNNDNGDLETLLMQITDKDKFAQFIQAYQEYIDKVKLFSPIKDKFEQELSEPKSKIYSFICSFEGNEKAKEGLRNYNSDLWNLTTDKLDPLKRFIIESLK